MYLVLILAGCGLFGGHGDDAAQLRASLSEAEAQLRQGDFAGAESSWQAILTQHPGNVDAASGAAFAAYARGDLSSAEATLAAAEADIAGSEAAGRTGELELRRALVALARGDTDAVRKHGLASGAAAGKVLAAEVALGEGEREEAQGYLQDAAQGSGEVATTARRYLELLSSPDPSLAGLAENYAIWALGQRKVAVLSVEEVVKSLPDDYAGRSAELLLWAGRAAAIGEAQVASDLLEEITFPPQGQAWRKPATRAIILCGEGEVEECRKAFDELQGVAPELGLVHARATAALLLAPEHAADAVALLGDEVSDASARAALSAGDAGAARSLAGDGLFRRSLAAR